MCVQKNIIVWLLSVSLLTACKERYEPPIVKTNPNYLVVDGFINNSADTTKIRLSRTRKLSDGLDNSAEVNSQLLLADADGNVLYYFQEMNDGNYIVPGMSLDINKKYKLIINTNDGSQFTSDDLTVKDTPLIDSVNWRVSDEGLTIYVNAHDDQNKTKYYRWDYTDTWEHHATYFSSFKYENDQMTPRTSDEDIYQCWTTKNSTAFLLGSSVKLSEDVIHMSPVRFIPVNAIELSIKYSILVRQYAITKEAYDYFQNLKGITEQLGSIFDAQPSQVTGNIHSVTNPLEPVLGFVTASSVNEKRIFINRAEVLPWFYQIHCEDRIIVPIDSLRDYFGNGIYIPTSQYQPGGFLVGYYGGTANCVDCRVSGGNTIKPDFWP